jgi:hypothetical protein
MVAPGPAAAQAPPEAAEGSLLAGLAPLLVVALYALPVVAMVRPVDDADIWWHLRTGQWVVEHRAVPQTDPFSAYGQGRPWLAYSWLFEVIVYGFYHWLGLTGLLVFRLAACGAVLVAVHRFVVRRESRLLWATGLTLLAFLTISGMMYERPWLFTLLFSLLTLEAVLGLRAGTAGRAVWLLPVMFALWANLHIQFVYGLALLGWACAAPVIDAALNRPTSGRWADAPGTPAWRRLVVLTAACAAATLLNPYHVRLYGVVHEYASQKVAFWMVHELQAPLFRIPSDWAFLALAGIGAFALGRCRARSSVFELLLLAGAAVAGFRARRDIWLLALVAIALWTALPRPSPGQAAEFVFSRGRVAVITLGVAAVIAAVWWQRHLSEEELTAAVGREYPVAAVRHVRAEGYPGPLFNEFDWGGYLIWALPEYPVSMDGRTNLHADERLARHYNTMRGAADHGKHWEEDPDFQGARLAILHREEPLAQALRFHPRFRLVYEDEVASVFVAREGEPTPTP